MLSNNPHTARAWSSKSQHNTRSRECKIDAFVHFGRKESKEVIEHRSLRKSVPTYPHNLQGRSKSQVSPAVGQPPVNCTSTIQKKKRRERQPVQKTRIQDDTFRK